MATSAPSQPPQQVEDEYAAFPIVEAQDEYAAFPLVAKAEDDEYAAFPLVDAAPEVVAEEAQRATTGAKQALYVMAAPRALNWSEVNEQMDAERFREAEGLRAQGQPEQAAALLNEITSFTTAGQYVAQQRAGEAQGVAEAAATQARGGATPSEALRRGLGPGLSSTVAPIVEGAARQALPAVGGILGAARFIPHPGAQMASKIGLPMLGAIAGSMTGGHAQEALLQIGETPEETQRRQQLAAEDQARNPGLTLLGGALAISPFVGPSMAQFGRAAAGDVGAMANLGIGGALNAGGTMVSALTQGRFADAKEIGKAFFLGMAMNEPTKLGRKLGLKPSSEQQAIEDATIRNEQPPIPIGADAENAISKTPLTETPVVETPIAETPAIPTDEQRIATLVKAGMSPEDAAAGLARLKATEAPPVEVAPPLTKTPESLLPEVYGIIDAARASGKTPAQVSKETGLPIEEVSRRSKMIDLVKSKTFAPPELPEPRTMPEVDAPETGGIFTRGKRAPVPLVGGPPSGDKSWIEIAPFYKRAGFEREGASKILQNRQQNAIGKSLGQATDRQFDVEGELAGKMWKMIDDRVGSLPAKKQQAAFDEVEAYVREVENRRPAPALSPEASNVLEGWKDVAEFTGLLAQAHNVKVLSDKGYRPMRLLGRDYIPRMFHPDFLKVVRSPKDYPAEFNRYASELASQRGVSPDAAAAMLDDIAGGKGKVSSNEFLGNLEMARAEKLPESFYDYDLRRVMSRYVNRYAQRMGQIVAYGQRLEGPNGPAQKNLWDFARDEVRGGDTATARWLNEAEAQSSNERAVTGASKLTGRLQTLATGLLLSNPTSTVPRNLLGGALSVAENFGYLRTAKAAAKQVLSSAQRMSAKEIGAVREDMASALHADQLGEGGIDRGIRTLTDTALKASGYNASEVAVRTLNTITASQFARDAAAAIKANPKSKKAKEAAAMLTRMGVEPAEIVKEGGDWKTGEATRTFIRNSTAQQQGGYRFNQVPLWAGSPAGRFFYQFGRWGTQRAQNLWENGFKPALVGTPTVINGVPMTVRDFKPLLRMGLSTLVLGEAYAGLSNLLFDRDRKDASLTEIGSALNEDQERAMKLIAGRLINDLIMGGTLGIWGQPLDFAMAAKDQSRLKNPTEPPGGSSIRALGEFAQRVIDQGTATRDDMKEIARSVMPGVPAVVDVVRNALDTPKYEAENDVRTLRNAGRRFADEKGLDVPAASGGNFRSTERTPVFAGIRDALLIGDLPAAKRLRDDYLQSLPLKKRKDAKAAIKSSVKARQPFRVGPFSNEDVKRDFYRWAERRLSPEDLEQVKRVQERYVRSATQLGLW